MQDIITAQLPQSPTLPYPAGVSHTQAQIKFIADKVRVNGPKVDGGYSVTFEVGEYEQEQVSELLKFPQQSNMEVSVKQDG
jgi:hypothetical protein